MDNITKWLASGAVGSSSKFMACCALGIEYEDFERAPYPHDPSDLDRCLKLLVAVPEVRQAFDKIAAASETWAALIARWDELERTFIEEAGIGWSKARSAPKTYKLMKSIIEPIEDKDDSIIRVGPGLTIKFSA